jgi:hypothetical protein
MLAAGADAAPLALCSELEDAQHGWSASEDAALLACAREAAPAAAGAAARYDGRRAAEVAARCHFLGCVLPRGVAA